MTKKTSRKKTLPSKRSLAKKLTSKPKALSQKEAIGYVIGDRVKCIVDMGHVRPGTIGKVTQSVPQADASVVRFDGASHDTLVALTDLQAIGYATGDRVKCTINIGPVLAGTTGTVTESVPKADASAVQFDGTSGDTLIPNRYLEPA